MKAVIPDRCYAEVFEETIRHCRENGAFDPTTMGSVPNVGLMAQKAEEYGSHDTTFEVAAAGQVRVSDGAGNVLIEHTVDAGDIWRLCRVKDGPIRDWVKLAVSRARLTGCPIVFWLDENRAHDACLIKKVKAYLPDHDLTGVDYQIMEFGGDFQATLLNTIGHGAPTLLVERVLVNRDIRRKPKGRPRLKGVGGSRRSPGKRLHGGLTDRTAKRRGYFTGNGAVNHV